jgi:hypothetical protein
MWAIYNLGGSATQANPEELEVPTKKPTILVPPKEADVMQIDLGTGDPFKTATISAHLPKAKELALTNFLRDNKDIRLEVGRYAECLEKVG